MKLQAFNRLCLRNQQQLTEKIGVLLCTRATAVFTISLYQLEEFYVELFYFTRSGNFATLHSFDNLGRLTPYLDEIDLSPLLI